MTMGDNIYDLVPLKCQMCGASARQRHERKKLHRMRFEEIARIQTFRSHFKKSKKRLCQGIDYRYSGPPHKAF